MIVLGLGTNIGDRLANLQLAINYLSESAFNITDISPIYESAALLKEGSPADWNVNFLNMTVRGETHLSPQALLTSIKCIENKIGRQDRGVWAPREIDIDILAYDSLNLNESNLKVPHSCLLERDFALVPFSDIAPNWRYPAPGKYAGKTAYEISGFLFPKNNLQKTNYKLNLQNKQLVA